MSIRLHIHSLVDASLFKQFIVREGVSFEIRGEFFNVLNTPEFGGPKHVHGCGKLRMVRSHLLFRVLTQANDPRIGQLTRSLQLLID